MQMFVQVFSKNEANGIIQALINVLKVPWMLLMYSITNGLTTRDLSDVISTTLAGGTRMLMICSLVKSEGAYCNGVTLKDVRMYNTHLMVALCRWCAARFLN